MSKSCWALNLRSFGGSSGKFPIHACSFPQVSGSVCQQNLPRKRGSQQGKGCGNTMFTPGEPPPGKTSLGGPQRAEKRGHTWEQRVCLLPCPSGPGFSISHHIHSPPHLPLKHARWVFLEGTCTQCKFLNKSYKSSACLAESFGISSLNELSQTVLCSLQAPCTTGKVICLLKYSFLDK